MIANLLYDFILGYNDLISNTFLVVSLHQFDFSPLTPILNPSAMACILFSSVVHHCKFFTLLSVFIPFLWLINGLFSGLGIKDNPTSLCSAMDFSIPNLSVRSTRIYPNFVGFGFKNLCNLQLQILPKDEVLYNLVYPMVGENVSFFIKIKLPLNQKDCGRNLKENGAIKNLIFVLPQTWRKYR